MSEIDYTLRDYRYPNEGYDGCETFAGVLRTFFPRWCADGKAASRVEKLIFRKKRFS